MIQITYIFLTTFETASGLMNNSKDNFFNENTFTYQQDAQGNPDNEEMQEVVKDECPTYGVKMDKVQE